MTTPSPKALNVFLSYCSEDKARVRNLYHFLCNAGFDVWMDEQKILGGQDWDLEINKALHKAEAVIVIFSKRSINKEGYIQKELRLALDKYEEKPDGTIYLIPALLEECELPFRWKRLQYIDLSQRNSGKKLIEALNERAKSLENKKQAPLINNFSFDPYPTAEIIPAIKVEPMQIQEKQNLHPVLTRGLSVLIGFLSAWLCLVLFAPDNTDFISSAIRIMLVFNMLLAPAAVVLLFHYIDTQYLEKKQILYELRYILSGFIGIFGGFVIIPFALVAMVIFLFVGGVSLLTFGSSRLDKPKK
jgi:hypothetical protein